MEKDFHEITQPKRRAFLRAYSESGSVTEAAKAAKVSRRIHYCWLADREYNSAFDDAKQIAGDYLETEARRRAVEGVNESVYYRGKVVGTIKRYSDVLLIFLLKGNKPEKFADRRNQDTDLSALYADPRLQSQRAKPTVVGPKSGCNGDCACKRE